MGKFSFNNEYDLKIWDDIQVDFLKTICDLMNKYQIPYWFGGGTLLGLYRDGRLIPGDNDHDIFIKIEDVTENFFNLFDDIKKNPKFNINSNTEIHNHYKSGFAAGSISHYNGNNSLYRILYANMPSIGGQKYNVCCDVVILFPYNDIYFYKCLKEYCFRFKAKHLNEFTFIEKYDRKIRIPANTDDYLNTEFTDMWRTKYEFNGWTHDYWHNWKNWRNELPADYVYKINK